MTRVENSSGAMIILIIRRNVSAIGLMLSANPATWTPLTSDEGHR
jgi:hypothetical protein